MADTTCAIRGAFFNFIDDPWKYVGHEQDSARFFRDGLLVVKNGVIEDFGTFNNVVRRHPDLPVTHLPGRLILPGFIDGHIHFPQVRVLGAYGAQLLDWLQTWIFPRRTEIQRPRLRPHRSRVFLRLPARRGDDDLHGIHHQQPGIDRGVLRRGGPAWHARDRRFDRHRPFRAG